MLLLNNVTVLVVEPDTFLALDIIQEIEAMGGTAVGQFGSLAEAHDALEDPSVLAALVNSDISDCVCELVARLETMRMPHVVHSACGEPWNARHGALHFRRPIGARRMLQSLSSEVVRLDETRLLHS